MQAEGAAQWPQQWRWTEKRQREYDAKGLDAMRVVDVEILGVRETGLLLPMRRVSLWSGIAPLLFGVPLVAMGLLSAVIGVIDRDWSALGGLVVLGGVGSLPALLGYAVLTTRKSADPGLYLTPSRIALGSGRNQLAVPWQDIAGISLHTTDRGRGRLSPRGHNDFRIDVHDLSRVQLAPDSPAAKRLARATKPGTIVKVLDDLIQVNPLLAYLAVRHYLEHPEQRRNIVSDAAQRR